MSKSTYQHQKGAIARYENKIKETHTKIQIRASKTLKERFDNFMGEKGIATYSEALEKLLENSGY